MHSVTNFLPFTISYRRKRLHIRRRGGRSRRCAGQRRSAQLSIRSDRTGEASSRAQLQCGLAAGAVARSGQRRECAARPDGRCGRLGICHCGRYAATARQRAAVRVPWHCGRMLPATVLGDDIAELLPYAAQVLRVPPAGGPESVMQRLAVERWSGLCDDETPLCA